MEIHLITIAKLENLTLQGAKETAVVSIPFAKQMFSWLNITEQ